MENVSCFQNFASKGFFFGYSNFEKKYPMKEGREKQTKIQPNFIINHRKWFVLHTPSGIYPVIKFGEAIEVSLVPIKLEVHHKLT